MAQNLIDSLKLLHRAMSLGTSNPIEQMILSELIRFRRKLEAKNFLSEMRLGSSHPTPSPSFRAAFPTASQTVQLGEGENVHGESVHAGWGKTGAPGNAANY